MDFILDSLFISLIIFCLLLLYRLVKQRVLHRGKSLDGHAVLMPIEFSGDNPRELLLKYELPSESEVVISLLDAQENLLETIIHKQQKAGDYFLKEQLPAEGSVFYLHFVSDNTKVSRKIVVQ